MCNMKRISYFFASVALVFGAMGTATAQEVATTEEVLSEEVTNTRRYEVGRFADNWSIGVGGGVNMYLGEHDRQMKAGDRLSPNLDVYVGKWFTPVVGFRLGYTGLNFRGATNLVSGNPNSTDERYDPNGSDHQPLYWQKFHMWNIHADFMVNLMNFFGGYKERVYSLSPYAGIGLARTYSHLDNKNPFANTRVVGVVGLFNTFRLGDALDLNVDLRGSLIPEDFEGETGSRPNGGDVYESEGYVTATVGLAYKFKPRGWNQSKTRTVYETNTKTVTVVDQDALDAALAQSKALEEELANAKAQIKTEVVESLLSPELYVSFAFNKSDLSGEARVTLSNLAKLLNAVDTKVVYKISGYADQQTGSSLRNQVLSEERAQAVYNFLVKEQGVDPAKLTVEAHGGVDTMYYNDNRLSRAVILTLQK